MTALPLWRSMLYVPASSEKFLQKAGHRGADAVILDLEDGVAADSKDAARAAAASAVPRLSATGCDVVVRINGPVRLAVRDLESIVQPGLSAVMLPKVESAGVLAGLDGAVSELEADRDMARGIVRFIPMIETPAALLRAEEIGLGSARNIALVLGSEDFATAMGLEPHADTLRIPNIQLAMAAKATGLMAIGLLDSIADTIGSANLVDLARQAARHGFNGATCIHPAAIPALNEGFLPSPEAVKEAQDLVAAMEAAFAMGHGAASHNGRMIDKPIYDRARKIVELASKRHEDRVRNP